MVLTCQSVSGIRTQLTWVGPNGPVTSGSGVTVITSTSQSTLAFHPLRVSHAGRYTCISTVEKIGSIKRASTLLSVQGKCNAEN